VQFTALPVNVAFDDPPKLPYHGDRSDERARDVGNARHVPTTKSDAGYRDRNEDDEQKYHFACTTRIDVEG
jgi:hypothetical protein